MVLLSLSLSLSLSFFLSLSLLLGRSFFAFLHTKKCHRSSFNGLLFVPWTKFHVKVSSYFLSSYFDQGMPCVASDAFWVVFLTLLSHSTKSFFSLSTRYLDHSSSLRRFIPLSFSHPCIFFFVLFNLKLNREHLFASVSFHFADNQIVTWCLSQTHFASLSCVLPLCLLCLPHSILELIQFSSYSLSFSLFLYPYPFSRDALLPGTTILPVHLHLPQGYHPILHLEWCRMILINGGEFTWSKELLPRFTSPFLSIFSSFFPWFAHLTLSTLIQGTFYSLECMKVVEWRILFTILLTTAVMYCVQVIHWCRVLCKWLSTLITAGSHGKGSLTSKQWTYKKLSVHHTHTHREKCVCVCVCVCMYCTVLCEGI